MSFKDGLFKAALYLSTITTVFSPTSVFARLPETPPLRNDHSDAHGSKRSLPAGVWGGWGLGPLSPPLPRHLDHPILPNGKPWGDATNDNTSPQTEVTFTGVVRSYEFTLTRGVISPDGIEKPAILVNDQYPGPLIEANWGDKFQITVHNQIVGPEEGTAIHWHGLMQMGTPWMDGAPSVGSSPLAPGDTFAYRFIADQYGTSWWHAHYSGQYVGGVSGPMVIYGPEEEQYDIDIGPIMIQDWFHEDYFALVKQTLAPSPRPYEPPSENTIINGKADCILNQSAICTLNPDLAQFEFVPGKVHRLRLINNGASNNLRFSIDDHDLTVIANDFVPLEPYTTDHVTLAVGQRADITVTANGTAEAYFMRVSAVCGVSIQPNAHALIHYNRTGTPATGIINAFIAETNTPSASEFKPTDPNDVSNSPFADGDIPFPLLSTFSDSFSSECANDPLSVTIPKNPIPLPRPDVTIPVNIDIVQNETQQWNWQVNRVTFHGNFNDPILFLAHAGNVSYPYDPQWNTYNLGESTTNYRMITYNRSPDPHPMHLHGHNVFVLAEGEGEWDGKIVRPENPQRRDVVLLAPGGYIVTQAEASNPGVWPYHCHIAWHLSGGLSMNFIEKAEEIEQLEIPHGVWRMFEVWNMYTAVNVVDQIDSGFWQTNVSLPIPVPEGVEDVDGDPNVDEESSTFKLLEDMEKEDEDDDEKEESS